MLSLSRGRSYALAHGKSTLTPQGARAGSEGEPKGAVGECSVSSLDHLIGPVTVRFAQNAAQASGMRLQFLIRDATTRLVFLNLVAWGTAGFVMVWTNPKYGQDSRVPLAYFGVLWAGYNAIIGFAGRSAALAAARYGRRPLLAAVGVLPIIAYVGRRSVSAIEG